MVELLFLLRKHIGFAIVCTVVICIFSYMSFQNYRLQTTITTLQQEKVLIEQAREIEKQKAVMTMTEMSEKYRQESIEREKYYAGKYKEVIDNYESTKSSVDGLYYKTDQIRNDVRSTDTSKETIIKYVDKYETVFKECVNEYTEVAADADKLVIMNQSLNLEIESIYTLLEEYRQKNPTISSD